uniref:Heparan-alpha-glucosaminide N-acetyltransferase catalytic domain-containing protein n=1 Tax=Acrobeloides nanus TaxID=290746 RepID=A0A914DJA9_9BILA
MLTAYYIKASVGANVNCYLCNDGRYYFNLTAPLCTGGNVNQWQNQTCPTGLCYYQEVMARLSETRYNFTDTTRDCYEKNNQTAPNGLLDGIIQFMNQTRDCLTTRYYIESINKENLFELVIMSEFLNTALITIRNQLNVPIVLYRQYVACQECPLLRSISIFPNATNSVRLSTKWESQFSVRNNLTDDEYFYFTNTFKNQGLYEVLVQNQSGKLEYTFQTIEETHENSWQSILYILLALFGIAFLFTWFRTDKTPNKNKKKHEDLKSTRLKSLDCFRGITILMMIFANRGSGGYYYLNHAPWEGLHFADVIFPWFIFIMGASIAISFRGQNSTKKIPMKLMLWKIALRSFKLFVIGLILSNRGCQPVNLSHIRIPGVLQRFAVSYFVIASLYVASNSASFTNSHLIKFLLSWIEWVSMAFFGYIYYWMTFVWHYDKSGFCPPGYFGPGGLHANRTRFNCTGGAAHALDLIVFTQNHIYQKTTCQELYNPDGEYYVEISHDPEGLLGCCTSIILAFIGLQLGKILVDNNILQHKIWQWISWAVVLSGVSTILHLTGLEPINKNLWSFSYICCTSALAFLIFTILYYLIDVKEYWENGYPFQFAGKNPMILYIGSEITANLIPWNFKSDSPYNLPHLGINLWTTTLWLIIAIILDKKNIFLTV